MPTLSYTMRGYDVTQARYVFWTTDSIDSSGSRYTGPGPLTDIIVFQVIGA